LQLPAEAPTIGEVEAFKVGSKDPRVGLRGQKGLRATERLRKGTVVGVYGGLLCTKGEYLPLHIEGSAGRTFDTIMKVMEDELVKESYTAEFTWWNKKNVDLSNDHGTLMVCAKRRAEDKEAHDCALINDPCRDPNGSTTDSGSPDSHVTPESCTYAECEIDGWPFLFVITVRDVPAGEELGVEYGTPYWDAVRDLERKLEAVRAIR